MICTNLSQSRMDVGIGMYIGGHEINLTSIAKNVGKTHSVTIELKQFLCAYLYLVFPLCLFINYLT